MGGVCSHHEEEEESEEMHRDVDMTEFVMPEDSDVEEGNPGGAADTDAGAGDAGRMNGIDIQKCLDAHNALRAKHGAPPLEWSDECSEHALAQAQICNDSGAMQHGNCQEFSEGQNIFMKAAMPPPSAGAAAACTDWYSEIENYDFSNGGFSMNTGHFTQLVWHATTHVGMAKVTTTDGMTTVWIVANYSPQGNMDMPGEFDANVTPAE